MTVKSVFESYRSALAILQSAFEAAGQKPGRDFERMEIEGDNLEIYTSEYNHACNCHPEDYGDWFGLPLHIADGLDAKEISAFLVQRKSNYESKEAKRKAVEKKSRDASREKQERATLNRLKEKYEAPPPREEESSK